MHNLGYMKLPSLQSLWQQTTKVFLRFPLQVLLTVFATGIWWYLIDKENYNGVLETNLIKLLCISNLALTLLLAADLYAEVKQFSTIKKWIFRIIALLICLGLFFVLHPSQTEADLYRLLILSFAFHLLVACFPFVGNNNLNGFWHYNKTLFLRFLTSILYAGVLYAGLSIAILAIDGLFNVNIDYRVYLKLLAVVGICFTTIFFLAGLPDDINSLNQDETYSKGLKIFTQYVLIPLLTIYLTILFVYEIKIAIEWQLPKGLVSTLILGYAVFGILSLLLIYPIKNNEGNGWIKLFSKFFYVMMLPLMVLLILAIVKRVGSYGITEPRYYLIILALWLSAITFYFLLSKKQNIKIIPISLCVMALLTLYGPQSAFLVAKISQIERFKSLIQSKSKNRDIETEKASIIRYLVKNHGLATLQSFTNVNLTSIEFKIDQKFKNNKKNIYDTQNNKIDTAFAILKVAPFTDENYDNQFILEKENKEVIAASDYDYCILLKDYGEQNNMVNGVNFKIERVQDKPSSNNNTIVSVTIAKQPKFNFDLHKSFLQIYNQYQSGSFKHQKNNQTGIISNNQLQFIKDSENFKITLVITHIDGNYVKSKNDFSWINYNGYFLINKK